MPTESINRDRPAPSGATHQSVTIDFKPGTFDEITAKTIRDGSSYNNTRSLTRAPRYHTVRRVLSPPSPSKTRTRWIPEYQTGQLTWSERTENTAWGGACTSKAWSTRRGALAIHSDVRSSTAKATRGSYQRLFGVWASGR